MPSRTVDIVSPLAFGMPRLTTAISFILAQHAIQICLAAAAVAISVLNQIKHGVYHSNMDVRLMLQNTAVEYSWQTYLHIVITCILIH